MASLNWWSKPENVSGSEQSSSTNQFSTSGLPSLSSVSPQKTSSVQNNEMMPTASSSMAMAVDPTTTEKQHSAIEWEFESQGLFGGGIGDTHSEMMEAEGEEQEDDDDRLRKIIDRLIDEEVGPIRLIDSVIKEALRERINTIIQIQQFD